MQSISDSKPNVPFLEKINFLPWRVMDRLPVILQNEVAECGLACLAMVTSFFGLRTDLANLRIRLGTAQGGTTMKQLIVQAGRLGLSARAVRSELTSLKHLHAPCILHWDMDHFVVLKKAGRKNIVIHDPRMGVRKLSYSEASKLFTGIAIEFEPNERFEKRDERIVPTFRSIMGRTHGLIPALAHILGLALLLELVALISPAAMQWLVDKGLNSPDQSQIVSIVAGLALLMVINLTVVTIRSWMVMYLAISVGFQWSSRVLNHLLHLPVEFFERRQIGDVMSRFGSVSAIQQTVTTGVIEGILDGLLGIGTLIMIWLYSPLLAMTAITAVLLLCLLQFLSFEPIRRIGNESLISDARVSSNFLESLRGIRPIKLANRTDYRRVSWQNLTIESINIKVRGQWLGIAVGTTGSLISGTQNLVAIYIAATLISQGQFTIGMLFAYLSYQNQFMSRTSGLVKLFFDFRMLRLHFERLADIVLTAPEQLMNIAKNEEAGELLRLIRADVVETSHGTVQFVDVSFKYSEFAPSVISNLSFSTVGSKCTVIVGRTGIGKTTIAKMIMGIYKPASGQIMIDGKPIDGMPVEELRQIISCVLQDDLLLGGSILENIAFFDATIDQAWVEQCAAVACVHEDIRRMTMGYYTPIGDMGSTLSAGQKQRLLIARALYRKPKILLLDEGTSDLDVPTEKQLNASLAGLNMHRIYIAHRPETIKFADQIIEIK